MTRVARSSWYRIANQTDSDRAEIYLYDEIGAWGVTASDFTNELRDIKTKEIDLHISSPGGEVFDGMAIYNAVRNHKATVTVYIDGIAASAASFIAMAGDRVLAERNATMMIHDGMGIAIGNANDMRELANLLDKCSNTIAEIYADKAGGTVADWRERMQSETWYTAAEARSAGLVDEVLKGTRRANGDEPRNDWDLSVFRYAGRSRAPAPVPVNKAEPQQVGNTACPSHDTATTGGTWDAGTHVGRLPSPMSVGTARKMYALYDADRVEDGNIVKDACSLPHHEVSTDGSPGAANLAGVRNALARLPQTQGYSDADRDAARAHLRNHLGGGEEPEGHTDAAPQASLAGTLLDAFDPDAFRVAMTDSLNLPFNADAFREAMQSAAINAPAPRTSPPLPIDLGPDLPAPPPAEPEPEPSPWDVIRHAMNLAANDAPAPTPPPPPDDPAKEPGFSFDATAFRAALREAIQ